MKSVLKSVLLLEVYEGIASNFSSQYIRIAYCAASGFSRATLISTTTILCSEACNLSCSKIGVSATIPGY